MAIRELDESSIHWGGLAGMRFQNDPANPLPLRLLGGVPVDEFLAGFAEGAFDPSAAGFGLLVDSTSSSSVQTLAWSLRDPPSSFYNQVLDNIFSSPGPALPSDELLMVPRVVNQAACNRGFQSPVKSSETVDVSKEHVVISKVFIDFLYFVLNTSETIFR